MDGLTENVNGKKRNGLSNGQTDNEKKETLG